MPVAVMAPEPAPDLETLRVNEGVVLISPFAGTEANNWELMSLVG